jgi:hypothetical protein
MRVLHGAARHGTCMPLLILTNYRESFIRTENIIWHRQYTGIVMSVHLACPYNMYYCKVKQSRYMPWRRLGGDEV